MEQVQKQRSTKKQEETQPEETKPEETKKAHDAALKKEIDDLLDEIDTVLVEDAEAMVSQYIQKGGE
jgi:prokaryotic ubiquitin-like protein Pup